MISQEADLHILGLVPGSYNSIAGISPYGGVGAISPYGGLGFVPGAYNALAGMMGAPQHHQHVPGHPAFHPGIAHPAYHPAMHPALHPALHPQGFPAGVPEHPLARLAPSAPGTPQPGMRWFTFPLLASAFTATSGTATPFNETPQHYFKGRRWMYNETRTGVSATGLVRIVNPAVGTHIQMAAAGSVAAGGYAPGAYDSDESLDPCGPGVTLSGVVTVSAAPANNDRIDYSLEIKGETAA